MRADREATSSSAWGERGIYVTGAALVAIAGISWVGVIRGVGMPVAAAQEAGSVSLAGAAAFLAGWGVMMAAMMLPSAMPMIALYGKLSRNLSERDERAVPTELFAAIYLAIWLGVGALVYLGGLALTALADAIPLVAASLPYALAAVLVGAGAYQLTALKQACLRSCRTPLSFLMRGWQGSYAGTLKLAGAHAAYCIGCCVALMVVLVVAGAMSLPWVLLIAAIVFVEKLLPGGELVARVVGFGFVILGLAVAIDPDLAAILRGSAMNSSM